MGQLQAKDLRGCMVAMVTPMDAQNQLDLAQWERLINWHVQSGTSAVVVAGKRMRLNDSEGELRRAPSVHICPAES